MIDTVSSPIEPDLCFMPRIEEREEDFLESTVDDESDEEQSISSTQHESPPAKFLMENYDFDITTHANKTSEKLSCRGSSTPGGHVLETTPILESPNMEMDEYSIVEEENSIKNANTDWEAKQSNTAHDINYL